MELALVRANLGLWDWDMAAGTTYFNPRYYTMLGYEPDELPATHATWFYLLHPGDRESTLAALREERDRGFRAWGSVFRLRTKSGDYRWIHAKGRAVVIGDDGNPCGRRAPTRT